MLGYPSFGSRREYATKSAKRYDSSNIAWAWAVAETPDGKCPSSMTFTGQDFYSYGTVIASRIEDEGRIVFLVSAENYSSSTSRHLSCVWSAVRNRGKVFSVPGVDRGSSNLADMPRILGEWQGQIERKVKESGSAREPKHTRLLIEAFQVFEKMREFAEYFHLSLRDYPVTIPVPEPSRCKLIAEKLDVDGQLVHTRLTAMRLGADPSPWMRESTSNAYDAALAAVATLGNTAAAEPSAA